MEPFVTMGLVLKETRYREADRILTILTPKLGVITAMAANSLRLKSKLFSACGLFCYSEFAITLGRKTNFIDSAAVSKVLHWCPDAICIPCGKPMCRTSSMAFPPPLKG